MGEKTQVASLSVASNTLLTLAKYTSVVDVHELCDLIEQEISFRLSGIHILIHAEPCSTRNVVCPVEEGLAPFCQRCQIQRSGV